MTLGQPEALDHTHRVDSGKARFTLDELAAMQPGLARLMPEIATRMWKCAHAGRAHNRPLARYQLSEATKLLRLGATLRPKYAEAIAAFVTGPLARLRDAIEDADWPRFEDRLEDTVRDANGLHEQFGKGFLVWKIPADPPPDLDLTPRGD